MLVILRIVKLKSHIDSDKPAIKLSTVSVIIMTLCSNALSSPMSNLDIYETTFLVNVHSLVIKSFDKQIFCSVPSRKWWRLPSHSWRLPKIHSSRHALVLLTFVYKNGTHTFLNIRLDPLAAPFFLRLFPSRLYIRRHASRFIFI